jgi:zinc transport system substrate-binding protein
VSRIAGDKADVLILVTPGQNPHNYEPTPKQIRNLSKASAWILSGIEFEISLRPKIETLFPNLLIIDGTEGVEFRLLEDHSHNCDEHDHDNYELTDHRFPSSAYSFDRHTWLGRVPAEILANRIVHTIVLFDSDNTSYYAGRLAETVQEIYNVFNELKIVLAPLYGHSVFVYHPSFGYFLDEFGIIQEAVEMGGKEPTPRQLNELMEKIKKERPAAIFVQKQFPVNAAKTIAGTVNAQVIELDPLAQDWLKNIKHMGQELKNIIK